MKIQHYHTSSGRDVILAFLKTCPKKIGEDYFDAVSLLETGKTLEMPLSRPLSSIHASLHELRFKDSSGIFRFFYYIKKKDGIYVIHAFKKKTEELPQKEKTLVLKRLREV